MNDVQRPVPLAESGLGLGAQAHAEGQPAIGELLLELLGGDLAQVADGRDLRLIHHNQVGDELDVGGAQGVLGAHREVERVDLAAEQRGALGVALDHQVDARPALELAAELEVLDEGVEMLAQDVGRLDQRELGGDRAVGPDLEVKGLEVGALAETAGVDMEGDALDRRVDRVDGDGADRRAVDLLGLGRDEAAAAADVHLEHEAYVLGQGGDDQVGVDDLDILVRGDVAGGDRAGGAFFEADDHVLVAVQAQAQALDVEDDGGDVLEHAVERGELVVGALQADRAHGGALETPRAAPWRRPLPMVVANPRSKGSAWNLA